MTKKAIEKDKCKTCKIRIQHKRARLYLETFSGKEGALSLVYWKLIGK